MKSPTFRHGLQRLHMDCKTAKRELLADLDFCSAFMSALVSTIRMKEMGRVAFTIDEGVSVAAVFKESGAQLHTWPEDGEFYLDVTSCKRFDIGEVKKLVEEWFCTTVVSLSSTKGGNYGKE